MDSMKTKEQVFSITQVSQTLEVLMRKSIEQNRSLCLGLSVTVYEAAKQHCLDTEETSAFSGSLNDKNIPCQREWVIRIPDRYVSNGAVARKIMDLGEMNLEVELEDEDQECIHH
ncbi:Transthyretin-like family protein [Onchocerca flexuosa]|uniref:Transthyretin-like family protein n=1 Tax=Onchocerca flexuosa TaxID=387005 RepID=A0A238BVD6_9BILA|nr:Transthyretin-like family protein [Onchocerca flexuosa]